MLTLDIHLFSRYLLRAYYIGQELYQHWGCIDVQDRSSSHPPGAQCRDKQMNM